PGGAAENRRASRAANCPRPAGGSTPVEPPPPLSLHAAPPLGDLGALPGGRQAEGPPAGAVAVPRRSPRRSRSAAGADRGGRALASAAATSGWEGRSDSAIAARTA